MSWLEMGAWWLGTGLAILGFFWAVKRIEQRWPCNDGTLDDEDCFGRFKS